MTGAFANNFQNFMWNKTIIGTHTHLNALFLPFISNNVLFMTGFSTDSCSQSEDIQMQLLSIIVQLGLYC